MQDRMQQISSNMQRSQAMQQMTDNLETMQSTQEKLQVREMLQSQQHSRARTQLELHTNETTD